ncbi:MAG TPA: efflux RND transporter periplasmic adaptor subunit [Vicinamibacterales bacterium]|nr:efflux RND transporter periplasmic adaptor subunit [Vicinamibacterales bacterium]
MHLPDPWRLAKPASILFITGLFFGLTGCAGSAPGADAGAGAGRAGGRGDAAVPVTIAAAVEKTVPLEVTTVGTGEPDTTVEVRAQVTGQLTAVHFTEGADVEQGQPLFTLDSRTFEAAVKQAEAILARDTTTARNFEATRVRHADLLKGGLMAQADYDQTATTAAAAAAALESDKAQLENAKLQLQYTKIMAPVSGRTGALLVHTGALVRANDTAPLIVINRLSPIRVSFAVPSQYLSQIRAGQSKAPLPVRARPQAAQGAAAPPESTGVVTFLDNAVDSATDTIRLKATFANDRRQLWPGQIVEVTLRLAEEANAVVVPATAVQNGQQGQFVFVVKEDKTVAVRPVKISRTRGDDAIVASGLAAGETVVTDGQLRLLPGSKIAPK